MRYLLVLAISIAGLALAATLMGETAWLAPGPRINPRGDIAVLGHLQIDGTPMPGVYLYDTRYGSNGQWGVVRLKIYESMYMPVPWSSATTTP